MALKCLEKPSRRLLQRCYSTINSQSLRASSASQPRYAPTIVPSIPSSTRSFTSTSLIPRSGPPVPPSIGSLRIYSIRSFSSSAIRSATPQEAYGSNITASYIASAGDLELVDVKKVLVIGSGGLTIGQAGEFDYSGMRKSAMVPIPNSAKFVGA